MNFKKTITLLFFCITAGTSNFSAYAENSNINDNNRPTVTVCGQPFGVEITTKGVEVVGFSEQSPAKKAGLEVGDCIIKVGSKSISSCSEIANMLANCCGERINLTVIKGKNGESEQISFKPIFENSVYKAGIELIDSCAGIGTMTFYDPDTKVFGGLGHPICESGSERPLSISKGTVNNVEIFDIKKGKIGKAGELLGKFCGKKQGEVLSNSPCGIFGTLDNPPEGIEMPIDFASEIHTGEAEIIATIDGQTPQTYTINIDKVNQNAEHDMIIRVTDERLLEKTGGIVQGMSGSPIVQDGKLAGAITHVLINNPVCGYGIFITDMLEIAEDF